MRDYQCRCGGTLFFHSMSCVACGAVTARCPACCQIRSTAQLESNSLVCDHCKMSLRLCHNRIEHGVCNAAVAANQNQQLCNYCCLNQLIPDLKVEGNLDKWRLLERAKHRVLYDVDRIGFPILTHPGENGPRLVFVFKAATHQPVSTGHASGRITIDIAEADSVNREQIRVAFGEPQRTLVGHFRHELGHYFWEVSVRAQRLDECRKLFGDERNPSYSDAQQQYYQAHSPSHWQTHFISEYATMHPWEDFAETFNAYLDMIAIVGTASHFQRLRVQVDDRDFDSLLHAYRDVGVVANELNRDMGLLDLVPEVFTATVVKKLRFIHSLRGATN